MSRIRDFAAARDRVGRLLEELRDLAAASEFPGLAEEAGEALERLRESRFHPAVMGQFKRGKSTLINALLGEPLLPSGILPLTSIATEIRRGPARRADFRDRRSLRGLGCRPRAREGDAPGDPLRPGRGDEGA